MPCVFPRSAPEPPGGRVARQSLEAVRSQAEPGNEESRGLSRDHCMFHLYCPRCDRASNLPPDTDAIVLLCPACNTRRELRNGPPVEPPRPPPPPPDAIAASPSEIVSAPLFLSTLSLPETRATPRGELLAEYPIQAGKVEAPMG